MIENVKRIVCDRCKTETFARQNDNGMYEDPRDWTRGFFYPRFEMDLCPVCSVLYGRFMEGYAVDGKEFIEVQ